MNERSELIRDEGCVSRRRHSAAGSGTVGAAMREVNETKGAAGESGARRSEVTA